MVTERDGVSYWEQYAARRVGRHVLPVALATDGRRLADRHADALGQAFQPGQPLAGAAREQFGDGDPGDGLVGQHVRRQLFGPQQCGHRVG